MFPSTGIGPRLNATPYVYTNPQRDTEIFSCDRVFVLSQIPLEASGLGSFRSDRAQEVRKHNADLTEIIREDMKLTECSHDSICAKMTELKSTVDTTTHKIVADLLELVKSQDKNIYSSS